MNKLISHVAAAVGMIAGIAAVQADGQSREIEELRREYDQQLRVMQQAFDERLTALEEKSTGGASDFRWYWKDGLRFDSNDGRFKLKFNGRIQWDNAFYDAGDEIDSAYGTAWEDGSEFRRARLAIGGTIYDDFEFKAQYDFSGTDAVDIKDLYIGVKTNFGKFRAGHFKEPFSLNNMTSSKDISFMERALPNAFAPGRNAGIGYFNSFADDMVSVAAGVFRNADDSSGDSLGMEDEIAITGRVTARPWVTEEGDKYLHLGVGASHREADDSSSTLRYRARPESHIAPARLVDTGTIAGWEDTTLFGLEAAIVYGPFHASAEYIASDSEFDSATSGGIGDLDADGYYIEAGYFITGEHRRYKAGDGKFDKVKPKNNFQLGGEGLGAWEVAARYSHIDLDEGGVGGGEEDNIGLALNWYLNPNMRIGLNYIHASVDRNSLAVDDDVDIIQSRFQVTW